VTYFEKQCMYFFLGSIWALNIAHVWFGVGC